jgi:AbrB family looped-hinge helix DNA binding protein
MRVILAGMTHRVGPKGQVVIPKQLRDQLDLRPGDEVVFWQEGDHVAVRRAAPGTPLRGRFARRPLVATLEEDRARDRVREDGT